MKCHCAAGSKQTIQNIVMVTHQESIMSHFSLLTTLNNRLQTFQDTNFQLSSINYYVGLKTTLVKFTSVPLCGIILSWHDLFICACTCNGHLNNGHNVHVHQQSHLHLLLLIIMEFNVLLWIS